MTPLVEILIHVSAPSRVIDDGKYRKQALGFLNFEAVARHDLKLCNDTPKPGTAVVPVTPYFQDDAGRVPSSQNEAILQFSADSFVEGGPSVLDSFAATDYRPLRIPASIYSGSKVLVKRTPLLPRPQTAPVPASPLFRDGGHRRSQSDSVETLPSVVPDSQPEVQALKRSFPWSSSFSSSASQNSPSTKRQRLELPKNSMALSRQNSLEDEEGVLYSALEHITSSYSSHVTSSPEVTQPLTNGIVEVRPPHPKTSSKPFKTHVTPELLRVEAGLNLARYYQPSTTSREIHPLERGHWKLLLDQNISTFNRKKFWDYLVESVRKGRPGWGVWCEKCPVVMDMNKHYTGQDIVDGAAKSDVDEQRWMRDEVVKVYCWGEVVGYIYLFLFMASSRTIKKMNAQWVDASGEVVVRMNGDMTASS